MTYKDFLSHCVACGGDWTSMLASGVKELWPEEYDALPETFYFVDVLAIMERKGVN